MTDSRQPGKQKHTGVEVYWTTVTYRTVWLIAVTVIVLGLVAWWLVHPQSFNNVLKSIGDTFSGGKRVAPVVTASQARFVNLEGRVEVRTVGSVQWVAADQSQALDKGDVIRTGPDGLARISFANGTTYVVKPDTLITVESNTVGQSSQDTRVAVHIRSGSVDLSTTTSGAEVSFEDATAQVDRNSRAAVRSDPQSQQHEITMQAGTAELKRGDRSVQLNQYDRVSFPTDGQITISRVLAPPDPTNPINLTPIFLPASVEFRWKPVPDAVSYHLRVSTSSMFNQIVEERRLSGTNVTIRLPKGEYFWAVNAIDARRGTSEASEVRKFSVFEEQAAGAMLLELDPHKLHGNVVELTGRTEPGATLLINGATVPNIGPDGRFQYFTPPLQRGRQKITIVGQNRRGGTAREDLDIVVP